MRYLIRLSVDRVVATEQLARVRIEELHRNAARGVAVPAGVYEVDSVKARGVTRALSAFAQVALIHHIFHLRNAGFKS